MRNHRLTARQLIQQIAERFPEQKDDVLLLFQEIPLDFPVLFQARLPFFAHRFGMIGITLCGRLYLLESLQQFSAIQLLSILRHEAEHVQQQQAAPITFYLRYCLSWITGFLTPQPTDMLKNFRAKYSRAHAAYRAIPYEVEAYNAQNSVQKRLKLLI